MPGYQLNHHPADAERTAKAWRDYQAVRWPLHGLYLEQGERTMITGELKSKINSLWEIFWTGGITNPLDVVEQMTYILLPDTTVRFI